VPSSAPPCAWARFPQRSSTARPRWRLHLHERHLLAEARPGPGVEREKLVGRLVPQLPVLGDPPLWPELQAVLAPTPHALNPAHGVGLQDHLVACLQLLKG
jgi:hypothetical protein